MKTIRTDLTAFSLTGLVVLAAVALILTGHPVPDWLPGLGALTAAAGTGAALPTRVGSTGGPLEAETSTPAAAGDQYGLNKPAAPVVVPVPAPAPTVETLPAAAAAAAVAPVAAPAAPGRDWTETFPAITAAQIAADRAGQA